MKKTLSFIIISAIGFAAITGCTKSSSSSSSTTTTTGSTYFMKATINGVPFSTNYAGASTAGVDIVGVNISGILPSIVIYLPGFAVNTYHVNDSSITLANSAVLDSSTYQMPISHYGTVIITTSNSSIISGTFSFTCADSTKVTNGSFTAKVGP